MSETQEELPHLTPQAEAPADAPVNAAPDAVSDAVPDATMDAPVDAAANAPAPDMEDQLRLAEALVFASATPVSPRALIQLLPANADADAVVAALRARYAGRGVELAEVAGGLQFRTAPDLAPRLKRVVQVPRRLPRVAMETLAIIAYHQPVTRPEIEEIRGASLAQNTLDALLEAGLIAPRGRKETPGRPTLWGTTPAFLAQFGLKDLRELPRREDLLVEAPQPHIAEAGETAPANGGEAAEAGEPQLPEIQPPEPQSNETQSSETQSSDTGETKPAEETDAPDTKPPTEDRPAS